MEITELEKLLDSLKGEESIFNLFNSGRHEELDDIHQTFTGAQVYTISRLNEAIQRIEESGANSIISLTGEPGIGKSTLLSTLLVNHHLFGSLNQIDYFRYDPVFQSFVEIFKSKKGEGPRAVVLDDVHYFLPDFVNNVIVKGSVTQFDRFVGSLQQINSLLRKRPKIGSALVYVTDTHGFRVLRDAFNSILTAADREDLTSLLPNLPHNNTATKFEIGLDTEFFGKTYAFAGGNIDFYNAALSFGELIREDTGLLGTNARLLRHSIGQVRSFKEQMDMRFFEDQDVAKSILKGQRVDPDTLGITYEDRMRDSLEGLNERILEPVSDAITNLSELKSEMYDYLHTFAKHTDEEGWSHRVIYELLCSRDIRQFLDFIRNEKSNTERFYHGNLGKNVETGEIESSEDITRRITEQEVISKEVLPFISDLQTKFQQEHQKLSSSNVGNYINRNFTSLIKQMWQGPTFYAPSFVVSSYIASGEARSMSDLFDVRREKLRTTPEFMTTVLGSHKAEMSHLLELRDLYLPIIGNRDLVQGYLNIYQQIRAAVQHYASTNPRIFSYSTPEREVVRKFVDNRDEFISRMNPHTIEVIRNLSIIPAYS